MTGPEDTTQDTARRVQAAAAQVGAPPRLRAQVADARLRAAPRRRPARPSRIAVAATLAALLVALAVVALPGGSGEPSVTDVASVTLRAPALPAPATMGDGTLAFAADALRFPGRARAGGWQPAGARIDQVAGRSARTVSYTSRGQRVGYTIVTGPALRQPGEGSVAYEGVRAAVVRRDGLVIVTWVRDGHTCILASRNAGVQRMLEIAARS